MWTGGGRRRWTCPIHLPYVCFHFGRINAFSGVDICLRFTRLICILIVYQRIIISLLVHDTQIHHCIQNICRFCWITQTTHRKLSNPLIKNILLSSNLQILFAVHWNLMRKQLTIRALTVSLSLYFEKDFDCMKTDTGLWVQLPLHVLYVSLVANWMHSKCNTWNYILRQNLSFYARFFLFILWYGDTLCKSLP